MLSKIITLRPRQCDIHCNKTGNFQAGNRVAVEVSRAGYGEAGQRSGTKVIAGFWGFSHTRFGGPGEKTPIKAETKLACGHGFFLRNPSGCIVGDS